MVIWNPNLVNLEVCVLFRKNNPTFVQLEVNDYYLVELTEFAGKFAVHFHSVCNNFRTNISLLIGFEW
jgi:hypothetical protein